MKVKKETEGKKQPENGTKPESGTDKKNGTKVESRKETKKEQKQKPKYNMCQNTAYFISFAWKQKEKKVIFLSMLLAAFVILNNLVNLYVSPGILSVVEKGEPVTKLAVTILCFTGAMMFCSAGLSYVGANLPYGKITVRTAALEEINKKTMTTSYPNVNDDAFIKLVAKCQTVTSDNVCATEAIWDTLAGLMHDGVCFILWLVLLSAIDPWMIAVILFTSVIGYFVNRYVSGYEYRHRDELSGCEKRLWYISNRARDYSAAKDIRIFNMRPWLMQMEEKAMAAYMMFHAKAEGVYAWGRIADLILTFLRNGIAYFYLIRLVVSGEITAARFLLYFSAVGGFTMWVCGILKNLAKLHRQCLDISTVRECLEYPECFKFEDGEPLKADLDAKYEIKLENVSFSYPGAQKETLSNINLTLHPGEKLAIVGVNGAGKTTLVRLICGMYDPTKGKVLLNGRDIREFNRRDYYALFSAVFQNFSILAGSIAANIAQTEDGIDRERVKKCVEEAGLKDKIESFSSQYDTLLDRKVYEEAVELSGGETQRLMLARALYKNAPMIVLDEPTAALDPIAESELYQKYNEMTAGRLSVYISHRLASTRFCDRIILLDENRIAEEGTHEELLGKNGRYAKLFAVQSRYYQESGDAADEPGEKENRKRAVFEEGAGQSGKQGKTKKSEIADGTKKGGSGK